MTHFSYITEKLVSELRKLFDDDEFIAGILVYADAEADQKSILEFIQKGEDVTVETVTVLALELDEARANL